jgi:glyoxylate/succinic semialdehyde reductase
MGTAMARNLLKAGYDVTVWNRTTSKCDALVSEGAKRGVTPKQTTAACDITFAMLADPAGAVWS